MKWLTGILLVAIAVLGGSLIWLTYSLNLFPNQLERKIQPTTPEQQELESLKTEKISQNLSKLTREIHRKDEPKSLIFRPTG